VPRPGSASNLISEGSVSAPIAVSRLEQKKSSPLRSPRLCGETWLWKGRMPIQKPNEINSALKEFPLFWTALFSNGELLYPAENTHYFLMNL
jgi:hypothetical protein